MTVISEFTIVTLSTLPRRKTPAPQVGPYLKVPNFDEVMHSHPHSLSKLFEEERDWSIFVWKGLDFSAPLRALWIAEELGLYEKDAQGKYKTISVITIVNQVNAYLQEKEKPTVTDGSILSNLGKASKYLLAAFDILMMPNRKDLTVRIVDGVQTQENIVKEYEKIQSSLSKLKTNIKHADACGFDIPSLPEDQKKAVELLSASH